MMAVKDSLRKEALCRRAAIEAEKRAELSGQICENILRMPEIQNARLVMSYMAFRSEAELGVLNRRLAEMGIKTAFPVCLNDRCMKAYIPGEWHCGLYGISEPDTAYSELVSPEEIDVVICPCAAFDLNGNRLGQGKGYYDRYLPACGNSVIIAAAFEAQKFSELPCDLNDMKVHGAATEKTVYRF